MKKKLFLWAVGLVLAGNCTQAAVESVKDLCGIYTVTSFTGKERNVYSDDNRCNEFSNDSYQVAVFESDDYNNRIAVSNLFNTGYNSDGRNYGYVDLETQTITFDKNWFWGNNLNYYLTEISLDYYEDYDWDNLDENGNPTPIQNVYGNESSNQVQAVFDDNGNITFNNIGCYNGMDHFVTGELEMEKTGDLTFHWNTYNPYNWDYPVFELELADGVKLNCELGNHDSEDGIRILEIYIPESATPITEVTIPDYITYQGNEYPVLIFGADYDSNYMFAHAQSLNKLVLPQTIKWLRASFQDCNCPITELWMNSRVPYDWNIDFNQIAIYIVNREYYRDYCYRWENVHQGWVTRTGEIIVPAEGDFTYLYLTATNGKWDWYDELKVTGPLNDTDLNNFRNLKYLRKLDLSEAICVTIPSSFLYESREWIEEVILPSTVTRIEYEAFQSNNYLKSINLGNVQSIGNWAFEGTALTQVDFSSLIELGLASFMNTPIEAIDFPSTIGYIPNDCFEYCNKLTKVEIPSNVGYIDSYAFDNCNNLKEVIINEGVSCIQQGAFRNCDIQSIVLPSTLTSIGNDALAGNNNLTQIKSKSIIPPSSGTNIVTGLDVTQMTLYVAPCARNLYRYSGAWSIFYIVEDLLDPVESININGIFDLETTSADDPVFAKGVSINNNGEFTLNGSANIDVNNFVSAYNNMCRYREWSAEGMDQRSTFVNNNPNATGQKASTMIQFYEPCDSWLFISFPYDVNVSDITCNDEDVYWVIREYDSEARAAGETGTTWKNMEAGSTLKAYKGYVMRMTKVNDYWCSPTFTFPSANATASNYFTTENVIVPIKEYPAEFSNNSSWNLVGNPYPAYTPFSAIDGFTAPITIWRGDNYQAYSPIDDDVILRPNEAFFVQCPEQTTGITFAANGRIHYTEAMNLNETFDVGTKIAPKYNSGRDVFNIVLSSEAGKDRARIVVNESAKYDYEIGRDASKFLTAESSIPQIYSVVEGINYDINERPLGDGNIDITAIMPTNGSYTFSINGKFDPEYNVYLIDLVSGDSINLCEDDYTFEAEAGTCPDRFKVSINKGDISGIQSIMSELNGNDIVNVTNVAGITVYSGSLNDMKVATPGVYIIKSAAGSRKVYLK